MMKEKKSSYFTATWKMLAAVIIGGIAGGVSVVIYEPVSYTHLDVYKRQLPDRLVPD